MGVDISVVLAGSESVRGILLIDEEEGGGLGGIRGAYSSQSEVFFQEVFCGLLFFWGEGVDLSYLRDEGVVEVDGVVAWA